VVRTRVGYGGGTTKKPAYRSIGDHSEALQIDYDPSRITYERLLDIFWMSHDPGMRPWSTQYRAVIFYHDEAQKRLALASREREAAKRKERIYTEVLPFTGFTLAEDYHQKYRLQQEPDLLARFDAIYPSMKDFVNSTAVARVNGFLGGYGSRELLEEEINSYGLPAREKQQLLDRLSASRPLFRGCAL